MRQLNRPIEMKGGSFSWGKIPIPIVVSHHKVQAERYTDQKRKPSSELKYSMRYINKGSKGSLHRFLGAVEEMIQAGKVRELVDTGALRMLMDLMFDDDRKVSFEAVSTAIECINGDKSGILSRDFIEDDGLDIILNLMHLEVSEKNLSREENIATGNYTRMIRGNSTYLLGNIIGNGLQDEVLDDQMVDLLLEKTFAEEHIERCNALFCFRVAVENDRNFWMDHQRIYDRALEMLDNEDEAVVEEALRLIKVYLVEDIIQEEDIAQESATFLEMSKSDKNFSGDAKMILEILEERGFIEE